jgi:hypothetical protein
MLPLFLEVPVLPLNPLSALGPLDTLNSITGGPQDQTASPSPAATTAGPSWLTGKLAQIVVILIGVVLIGAGLFQFKPVQQITGAAAKVV